MWHEAAPSIPAAFVRIAVCAVGVPIAISDVRTYRIPHGYSAFGICIALAGRSPAGPPAELDSLLTAGLAWAIAIAARWLTGGNFGRGDIRCAVMVAAGFGMQGWISVMLASCGAGVLIAIVIAPARSGPSGRTPQSGRGCGVWGRAANTKIPFAAALTIGTVAVTVSSLIMRGFP